MTNRLNRDKGAEMVGRSDRPQQRRRSKNIVFRGVQLDLALREIRRDEVVQLVQPKVFDVLTHLIAHRDRVVTKTELLNLLWPGVVVSQSVLPRAVMKAREAIGDTDDPPSMIKTVPRVGYRFVESPTLDATDAVDLPVSQTAAGTGQPVSVCVMPIDNCLAREAYGWVPLGLSSMISQAFNSDARFALVPVVTMLQVLETLGSAATANERAAALAAMLGTSCIVQSTVELVDALFVLTYRGHGSAGHGLSGRLEGRELTGLGHALAMAIERHVFPSVDLHVRFDSVDPLANQAFARAWQARAEQKYAVALNLLEVVLDIEPRNTAALFLKLQVLMNTVDPGAQAVGEQLLQQVAERGDQLLLAEIHAFIAFASLGRNGPGPLTVRHAEAAMALCGEGRADAGSLRVYRVCAMVALARGDDVFARVLATRCFGQHQLAGDRYAVANTLMILAYCDVRASAYTQARLRFEQSYAFFSSHGFRETAIFALSNLATLVNAPSGLWTRALRQCDQVAEGIQALGGQRSAILPLALLSGVYAEFALDARIEQVLCLIKQLPVEATPHAYAALLTVQAHLAIAKGDIMAAREPLNRALGIHRALFAAANIRLSAARLLRNEMRAGCYAEAKAIADDLLRHEPTLQADAEIEGLLLHAEAASLHTEGDRPDARRRLAAAIMRLPPGDSQARARLDAAWIAIEEGELDEARAWLDPIPQWVQEHPLGTAVRGRMTGAEGKQSKARAAMANGVAATAAVRIDVQAQQLFCDNALNGEDDATPRMSRFLTTLHHVRSGYLCV